MRLVGIVLCLAAMLVGIGSNLDAMLDIPSLVIVLGGTIGMLLLGGSDVGAMAGAVTSAPADADRARAAARGWKMARIYLLAAGGIGAVIGSVIVFKNLDDPAAIGPGMALSMLSLFWALLLAFALCLPCQANAERAFEAPADDSSMATAVMGTLASAFVGVAFFTLLLCTLKP